MKDILEEIVAYKRHEVEEFKRLKDRQLLEQEVEAMLHDSPAPPSMSQALTASATGIIAEFKRKSPSKGWIKENGSAAVIPLSYQQQGAAAVSILTDSHFFGGADAFITTARNGRCVERGEEIGRIVSPLTGQVLQAVTAPDSGLLFTIRAYPVVYEGSLIARIHKMTVKENRK